MHLKTQFKQLKTNDFVQIYVAKFQKKPKRKTSRKRKKQTKDREHFNLADVFKLRQRDANVGRDSSETPACQRSVRKHVSPCQDATPAV
jgi:hypothetical protein